jgi:hypothetical protein
VKTVDCCCEEDVLDALSSGRWPDRADDELRAHVGACAICTDVVAIASAVLEVREGESTDMRIPSSAVMWWRAQMRARQEAAREAARPINVAQVVALVSVAALTVVSLVALSPWLGGLVGGLFGGWLSGIREAASFEMAAIQAPSALLIPALMIGVWLVLAPVAIYFAVAEDEKNASCPPSGGPVLVRRKPDTTIGQRFPDWTFLSVSTIPGFAPVCSPLRITGTPLTST